MCARACVAVLRSAPLRRAYIHSFNSIQFNSIQFNSIQFNSIQFNSIQFNSIQFNSIQFNSILIPPWVESPGGYLRACAGCAGNARVRTVLLRALSVCVCVCVCSGACGLFFTRGAQARLSPVAEAGRTPHSPTLRVDTFPPRSDHIHQHTTSPSSTDLPREKSTEDPGAPLLCAVCASPSSQQPPGSGAAKSKKNSEATRKDGKLLAANA